MATKKVIVYGGRGALGSSIVKYFKSKGYWVGSIDLSTNEDADCNIILKACESWTEQESLLRVAAESSLGKDIKVDAIFCVAGGWAGGNASNVDFIRNADLMWKQSVWSSCLAAQLGTTYLTSGGLLTLTGAEPALGSTPGMIGYGMAKAAVLQLTRSLASKNSGLPSDSVVSCLLPITLDTPMNRKFMPKADFSKWTPLEFVCELFHKWLDGTDTPSSGSLIKLVTLDGKTNLEVV